MCVFFIFIFDILTISMPINKTVVRVHAQARIL